jgi:outer membrane lipoprotein carrier protein
MLINASFAKNLPLDSIVDRLELKYKTIQTIQGEFKQNYTNVGFNKPITYTGDVFLKKKGKLRWDYKTGEEKHIISDGKTLWIHKPKENEILTYENFDKASKNAGISFLWGNSDLKKDFTINEAGTHKDFYLINLVPKRELGEITSLIFVIYKKDFIIYEVKMIDILGNENKIEFSKLKINKKLNDNLFKLK